MNSSSLAPTNEDRKQHIQFESGFHIGRVEQSAWFVPRGTLLL